MMRSSQPSPFLTEDDFSARIAAKIPNPRIVNPPITENSRFMGEGIIGSPKALSVVQPRPSFDHSLEILRYPNLCAYPVQ
jgi:hypothetical protein